MIDRRLLAAVGAALLALAAGVVAVVVDAPALGLLAGALAIVPAAIAAAVMGPAAPGRSSVVAIDPHATIDLADPPAPRPIAPLASAVIEPDTADPDTAEPDIAIETEPRIAERPATEPDSFPTPASLTGLGLPASTAANDPLTGLLDEVYFTAALDRSVASARRQLQPLSLVLFELDGLDGAGNAARDQAMELLGEILRLTLRECDTACRVQETMAAVLLEDTPETGAVWAAERVRGGLLASHAGDHLTVSAGVASYPSHALDAGELLARAERALACARAQGRDRVEIARAD